jgi:hypothetical protein
VLKSQVVVTRLGPTLGSHIMHHSMLYEFMNISKNLSFSSLSKIHSIGTQNHQV